jgi:2-polyprenyl-3-methyl-5-hydroxy-6-metoxy-1,4-benzoquinol methylase
MMSAVSTSARYDGIADWYQAWVADHGDGLIAASVGDLVPTPLEGVRVLDVACGHGRASRALARRGAQVVGVDLSADLIMSARSIEADDGVPVSYHAADIADVHAWWDGTPFDGALCEMAVMDIDDLAAVVRAVAIALRPGGWFVISMVHPCFPGNDAGLSSWPPDRSYFDEGWWTSADHNPDGVRLRVGSSHRTLSTMVNTLIDSQFTVERVVEPPASVPTYLLIRCTRD